VSVRDEEMSMVHWNDTDRRKSKYSKDNFSPHIPQRADLGLNLAYLNCPCYM